MMAEQSGFFPDVSGDRGYTTDFLALWVKSFIGNGVYNGDLAVTAGSNMQIKVPSGQAWVNGYYYRNDGDLLLSIVNADGVLHRKDTVVLRWDINSRSITAQVLQGTPASSPTAPAIVRTAEQYDLKLAEISIPAGTTAITQALITDTRLDNSVCGIVTGVVQQVNTTALYNQIQSDLSNFKSGSESGFSTWSDQQKASFNAWLDGIKQTLNADTAGNLLNMINTHESDAVAHMTQAQKDTLAAAVPNTRKVNGHTLDQDVNLTSADTGSIPASASCNKAWNWSGQNGQPSWLWGSNDGTNMYVYNPSNFSVTLAAYAHYSSHAVGSGSAALRNITMSTAGPSGGSDGDVWHQH